MQPMTYTVKFKRRFQLLWRRIRDVAEDGVIDGLSSHRYFITKSGQRHEVPTEHTRFVFSGERANLIEDLRAKEANQPQPAT